MTKLTKTTASALPAGDVRRWLKARDNFAKTMKSESVGLR